MTDKMRVHILAKELNVPSKTIIEKCRAEGIDTVKNHMSTLSAGLHATIREWFSEERTGTALETTRKVDLEKVRLKPRRKKAKKTVGGPEEAPEPAPPAPAAVAEAPPETEAAPPDIEEIAPPVEPATTVSVLAEAPEVAPVPPEHPLVIQVVPEVEPEAPVPEAAPPTIEEQPAEPATALEPAAEAPALEPEADQKQEETVVEAPPRPREPIKPAGPQHIPAPARLQGPRVVRYEAPDYDARRVPRPGRGRVADVGPAETPVVPDQAGVPGPGKPGARAPARRRGRVNPRRAAGRLVEAGERLAEWRDQDLAERKERLAGATGRRIVRRRVAQAVHGGGQPATTAPKTVAIVNEPVRMKEFCSETGLSFIQLFKVLKDEHDMIANINMTLPIETAQLLALNFGIDLEVIPEKTLLAALADEFAGRPREHLQRRSPVVALLGHVDHGKTSLLDAIRKAHVAESEDGGITQHISSYHINTAQGSVTFLDTPGHEAFTAMRARGAQVTDVVVLVVAVDDGVMPQTVEAINHARAAEVPIVVALNKIDLGDQNKLRIYSQLTERGLTPSGEWGGDIDVIPTSATTNVGVNELVDHLADLSSVLELRADPTLPAAGTAIEAETKPGVGAVAQVLIQEGTLHVGDFVVCGNAAGKVRALRDDRGRRITAAGPAVPVEVWGLDDVPTSGDKLYQVDSLPRAKQIAEETKRMRVESNRLRSRKVRTLQEMLQQRDSDEVPELNVVIKADVDGSVAALSQSLSEIPSDEVRLTIRHAGVGAVNDSDIHLASTCGGIVVAFRVEASTGARRLSEQHGVDIRSYRVIYDVCDEIKKALEGLLAPEETLETRGRAEVRDVFHLSRKAGVVAGSYVTDGFLSRTHLAKVIRDGVIIRDGAKVASLRRFKDDVKDVRAGFECGIRLEGFDDIHIGDTIEAYEIIKTARTL